MDNHTAIEQAKEHFGKIISDQLERIEKMKNEGDFVDYQNKDEIVIGVVGGDGIGPFITKEAEKVIAFLLKDDIDAGKIKLKEIDGLTIENRIQCGKAIPDDVMEELKACDVILKGPTTTPRKGDGMPNIESANVAMRKALDLFANVRPVSVPEKGIDWTFYRENTEGGYAVGSQGINVNDDLAIDFTVATQGGSERIIRACSQWIVIDFASRRPMHLKDCLPEYEPIHEKVILEDRFPKLPATERDDYTERFLVRYDDIDRNDHVNNAIYSLWASESLEPQYRIEHVPAGLIINFRKEGLFGEKILVHTQMDGDTSLHSIQAVDDNRELARVQFTWQK